MTDLPRGAAALTPVATTAVRDLVDGLVQWRLWGRLGWLEVKRRYRRTVIGPFWSAISLGVFVLALGSVGSGLWDKKAAEYLPFLASGMVVWVLVSTIITESCGLFAQGTNLYRQMRLNYSTMAYALVYRNLVVFLHNLVVFVLISLAFGASTLGPAVVYALPGLILVALNGVWIALVLGLFCLRFRDLQQLVGTLMLIAMFITPIFWPPESLQGTGRTVFIDLNPLFHLIEVVRAPLLGRAPSAETWLAALAMTAVGWAVAFTLFGRFRRRIAYWG
jgi:ABC-type polysaccharide/polyol phosphate export permease